MPSVSFSACINHNVHTLGEGCANLGKIQFEGFLGIGSYALFLSCDDEAGWTVSRLHIFEIFFRNVLGFYEDTHWNAVQNRLHKVLETAPSAEVFAHTRIQKIWEKRFFKGIGNTDAPQIDLFIFPDMHTDTVYQKSTAKFIKDNYRPGDVILVEGLIAGNKIPANRCCALDSERFSDDIEVEGWEPENVEEYLPNEMREEKVMRLKIRDLYCTIKDIINQDAINNSGFMNLMNALPGLVESYQKYAAYFNISNPLSLVHFQEAIELAKTKVDSLSEIKDLFYKALQQLHNLSLKQVWDIQLSPAEWEKIDGSIIPRNHSLCTIIDRCRNLGKRIFVLAGEAHILHQSNYDVNKLIEIQSTFKKHKFVILAHRSRFDEWQLGKLNPDLDSSIERKFRII